MGKVKAAALTVIFTVILAVLCALCVMPEFTIPFTIGGNVKDYNSVLKVMSLDSNLGGGYYTYYYPEGVVSSSEYQAEYDAKMNISESEAEDYAADYIEYGSIYLEKSVWNDSSDGADEEFIQSFDKAVDVICQRYEALELDYLKIEVVDDYSIRIEVSSEVESPATVFSVMAASGDFTLRHSSKNLPLLRPTKLYGMNTYFKSVSSKSSGSTPYVRFSMTDTGRNKFTDITAAIADNDDSTLYFYVGETTLISLSVTETISQSNLYISGYTDATLAKSVAAVFDSCLNEEDIIDIDFVLGDTHTFESIIGENAVNAVYIGVGVAMLAMFVYSVIRFRGMGAAHIYGFLSYMVVTVMCVGLIESIQLSYGGILAVILGGVLLTISNYYIFAKIKEHFMSGKRIVTSIKTGYKECLAGVIDVHVVLILASLVLYFVGISEISMFGVTFAIAALVSGVSSLLLTRFYFAMLMGNVKNQFKFCNFKREVTDDEDE